MFGLSRCPRTRTLQMTSTPELLDHGRARHPAAIVILSVVGWGAIRGERTRYCKGGRRRDCDVAGGPPDAPYRGYRSAMAARAEASEAS